MAVRDIVEYEYDFPIQREDAAFKLISAFVAAAKPNHSNHDIAIVLLSALVSLRGENGISISQEKIQYWIQILKAQRAGGLLCDRGLATVILGDFKNALIDENS